VVARERDISVSKEKREKVYTQLRMDSRVDPVLVDRVDNAGLRLAYGFPCKRAIPSPPQKEEKVSLRTRYLVSKFQEKDRESFQIYSAGDNCVLKVVLTFTHD
jgi:hypothetical protein